MAFWVNDNGQAVGSTGTCANTIVPPFGAPNPNRLGIGNVAFAINNKAQVTGVSVVPDGVNTRAFLWTSTLPGDNISAGLGMNNLGDIAGASIAGPDPLAGLPKAVVWHNGIITDLNTVVPADISLFLLTAFMINDAGQVAGFGVDLNTFEVHGFLATPLDSSGAPEARDPIRVGSVPPRVHKQLRLSPYF